MTDMHELLRDFADLGSTHVRADPRAASTIGARRRRRRRGVVVAAAAVVVLLCLGVGIDARRHHVDPADAPGAGADYYPTRIGKPLIGSSALPQRPGPVAGVVDRVAEHTTYDENLGWYVVSQTGKLWPLGLASRQVDPALSSDGTHLGYLRDGGVYVARDLTTGAEVTYPMVAGMTGREVDDVYQLYAQVPSFWSPDNQRIATTGAPVDSTESGALVFSPDGEISFLPAPTQQGAVFVIGWADSSHLVWLTERKREVAVVVTDLDGGVTGTTALTTLAKGKSVSQWSGSVSPDGSLVAVTQLGGQQSRAEIYSRTSGTKVQSIDEGPDLYQVCGLVWQQNRPAVPTVTETRTTVLSDAKLNPLIQADPRLATRCSLWSSTALAGTAHQDLTTRLFGKSTSTLSWRWREWSLGAGLSLLAALGLITLARRASHWRRRNNST